MRYKLHRLLTPGRRISLFFTMRCPVQCSYCSLREGGMFPLYPEYEANELSLDEWKPLLLNLFKFIRVSDLNITGGEPTLRKDISSLVNFLLEQGKCVTMHSNLWTDNALAIRKTNRFLIWSTFHHSDKQDRYMKMLEKYQRKYRVIVTEIGEQKIEGSVVKDFEIQGPEIGGSTDRFAIAPDGHIFVRMSMFYKHLRLQCGD